MADHSDVTSTTNTDTSPQLSFEVEEQVKTMKQVQDVEAVIKPSQKTLWLRTTLCVVVFFGVVCCIVGAVVYYTIFKPKEEPIIQTGNYSATLLRPEMDLNLKNGDSCPQNWTFYDGKCFLFSPVPVHMSDTAEYCSMNDGKPFLTNIVTAEVQEFLFSNIKQILGCCLYDLSIRYNMPSIIENMDEEIRKSMSFPKYQEETEVVTTEMSTKNPLKGSTVPTVPTRFVDDPFVLLNPEENTMASPLEALADTLPEIEGREAETDRQQTLSPLHDQYSSTESHPNGFWLGAGHDHSSHGAMPEGSAHDDYIWASPEHQDDNADTNIGPSELLTELTMLKTEEIDNSKSSPALSERSGPSSLSLSSLTNLKETLPQTGTEQVTLPSTPSNLIPPIGFQPPQSSMLVLHDKEQEPQELESSAASIHGVSRMTTSRDESLEVRSFDWLSFCSRYNDHLPKWKQTGCHGSFVQICERNPESSIDKNENIQTTSEKVRRVS